VEVATQKLEELDYSVVTLHVTGAGGLAMERLTREGHFVGVLDVTTSKLVDELVGGALAASSHRLEAAASCDIPQVVSVGALDIANFGPVGAVPGATVPSLQCLSHSGLVVEQPSSMQSLPQDKRQLILGWLSRTDERIFVVFRGSRCLSIIVLSGEALCGKTK
jgi:uncharacterized protein (UPF0261 family)